MSLVVSVLIGFNNPCWLKVLQKGMSCLATDHGLCESLLQADAFPSHLTNSIKNSHSVPVTNVIVSLHDIIEGWKYNSLMICSVNCLQCVLFGPAVFTDKSGLQQNDYIWLQFKGSIVKLENH